MGPSESLQAPESHWTAPPLPEGNGKRAIFGSMSDHQTGHAGRAVSPVPSDGCNILGATITGIYRIGHLTGVYHLRGRKTDTVPMLNLPRLTSIAREIHEQWFSASRDTLTQPTTSNDNVCDDEGRKRAVRMAHPKPNSRETGNCSTPDRL